MSRTLPLTTDDLAEVTTALEAIRAADEALRDLYDRCKAKGDDVRVGRLRVALFRLDAAKLIVESSFR